MMKLLSVSLTLLACLTCGPPAIRAEVAAPTGEAIMPQGFVANLGQVRGPARYYALGRGSEVYFEPRSVLLRRTPESGSGPGAVLRVEFPGAVGTPRLEAVGAQESHVNVFQGRDPSRWREGIPVFGEVRYHAVAPGAEIAYRVEGGRLKYDLILAPRYDLSRASLRYRGADGLSVDGAGALVIQTPTGPLREEPPLLYQEVDGVRVPVAGGYRILSEREVGFWAGRYDRDRTLVVDPGMPWSTFLGGTASDSPAGIARNQTDEVYVVGTTASTDYPTTAGAFQTTRRGDNDVVVTKLRKDGSLVWSTYLGGSRWDAGRAVVVDASGNVYLCGETLSEDFPTTAGAFRRQIGMVGTYDAFVTKIGPSGSVLVYSTYLGGISDDKGAALAVNAAGQAIVAGGTGSTDFPTTSGVVKPSRVPGLFDGSDGFVTKLNATGTGLVYSTYLGSNSGTESVRGLAVDASDQPVLTGATASPDYPTTSGALQRLLVGIKDAYVTRLSATGSAYVFSTMLGGTGIEEGYGVGVDGSGNAYVVGATTSVDFPTTSGVFQRTWGGGTNVYDGFVTKLSPAGAIGYSSFLGGSGSDVAYGVAVSSGGQAYVTGVCTSTNFPVTSGAISSSYCGGGADGFASSVAPSGATLAYSTYLGSSGVDQGQAIALRWDNCVLVAGYTDGAGFPTASGFDRTYGGAGDGTVSLIDMGAGSPTAVGDSGRERIDMNGPIPNPFRSSTSIALRLDQPTRVAVHVLDVQGRLVKSLADGDAGAGWNTWHWNGGDAAGRAVEPGVYLIQVVTPFSETMRRVARLR